jgi:hypothetical protein
MDSFSLDFADLLVNTATVQRFTETVSANGGTQKTFAAVSGMANLPCSRQGMGGLKDLFAGERQIEVTHAMYFNIPLAIQNGDRIVDENGAAYVVQDYQDAGGTGETFTVYALLIHQ